MKPFGTSTRSWFASVVILSTCSLACTATGGGPPKSTGRAFDGACVAAKVRELRVSSDGAAKGQLSVQNGCSAAVMLLVNPVHADLVRTGQPLPWMGLESGRNAFVRLVMLQDGADIEKAFAGDAVLNVYAPLKALYLEAGAESSVPIEGQLALEASTPFPSKGQFLLPCFPVTSSVMRAAALDLGSTLGKPDHRDGEPRRLPSAAVLVHTPLFPIHMPGPK